MPEQTELESLRLLRSVRQFKSQRSVSKALGVTPRTLRRWESGEVEPPSMVESGLREILYSNPDPQSQHGDFTFIDLFAGIGGMRIGFEAVGGRCLYTSEWNKFAQQTYRENFGSHHEISGDITAIDKSSIPVHDVLAAGFPCQPFSIAGVSKKNALGREHGFKDKAQGTLFFDILEILDVKKPAAFLLENVKNLVSHDKGNTFKVIINSLRELGYTVGDGVSSHSVINAKRFVPQHRERTFIVGFRRQTGFSWSDLSLPPEASGPVLSSILHPENGKEVAELPYTEGARATVCPKYILTDHLWKYLRDYAAKHKAKGNGFGFGLVDENTISRTLSARYYKDGSEILVSRGKGKNPRRLTPRECARLMGFDSIGRKFKIPVSDTQAYKQFGNAVSPLVVQSIAQIMKPHIMAIVSGQKLVQLPIAFS